MSIIQTILVNLIKGFASNDQVIAGILEAALPQEAPFIALADAIYQAELKSPGTLAAGLSFPLSIKGTQLKVTVSQ